MINLLRRDTDMSYIHTFQPNMFINTEVDIKLVSGIRGKSRGATAPPVSLTPAGEATALLVSVSCEISF